MRLLHVISSLDRRSGGTLTQLLAMALGQRACGIDVSILSTWSGARPVDVADEFQRHGCNVRLIGPAKTALQWHPRLRPELTQAIANAEVVHIHALWEQIQHAAARIAGARGVPYVISPHGMLDPWSLSQSGLKKRMYLALRLKRNLNGAAALHFTDEAEAELVKPMGLKPPVLVEPCGIDLSEFTGLPPKVQMRAELVQQFPHIGERPILLFLSRIHPKKGLDLLIPALARAQPRNAVLLIAGPDPSGYMGEVRRLIRLHQLEERVIETGMLTGRARLAALAGADLFVLPSYQENFGLAVVEALAAGTPVVISDQVNIHRHITQAGVGGVSAAQVEPLAAMLTRWMTDAPLRSVAAATARAFVAEHYDQNVIAQRWKRHYARLGNCGQ